MNCDEEDEAEEEDEDEIEAEADEDEVREGKVFGDESEEEGVDGREEGFDSGFVEDDELGEVAGGVTVLRKAGFCIAED